MRHDNTPAMKKKFRYLKLFSILFLIANSLCVYGESETPLLLKIEVPYIELHSGPGIGYPILYVIEQGESVSVLFKRTGWLKVKDKRSNEGWLPQSKLLGFSKSGTKLSHSKLTFTDFQSRDYEVGIMYGDFDGANFYNIQLDYRLSEVFSAEVSAGKALSSISDSDVYELLLLAEPLPELVVSPYVAIGGGIINTKPHSVLADSKTRQDTLMSTAIGVKYHLARNFVLRAEYKYSLVLTDRDNNEEIQVWKLGFSVFF